MTEDPRNQEQPVAEDLDELSQVPPGEAEEAADADDSADASPDGLLARVQQERDELEQRLMRIAADYENYKKRALRNVTEAEEQALISVGRGLVTVMDHFDRALDVDEAKANTKDVLAGLKIVHDELLAALARFGITRVNAEPGTPFDPNRHEALMRTAAQGIEPDHVVQQFQPGYAINDKTLRPAQVSVAS